MVEQIGILVFGVAGVALTQARASKVRRYASIAGLVGQGFWFYATYVAHQWGMFAASFLYTGVWMYGFYNNWIRKCT